jgi:hypothetical protein
LKCQPAEAVLFGVFEREIGPAVEIQSSQSGAGFTIDPVERAADENTVLVQVHRPNLTAIVEGRIELGIDGAIGVQTGQALPRPAVKAVKHACDQDLPVGLQANHVHRGWRPNG